MNATACIGNVYEFPKRSPLTLVRNGKVSPKESKAPDHGWTVARTIFAGVMVGLLTWVGLSLVELGKETAADKVRMDNIYAQQTTIIEQQKEMHSSILVMSATYASKEDLEKQRDILMQRIRDIEKRLNSLER